MLSPTEIKNAIQKHGSQTKAAAALGIPKTTFQDMCVKLRNGDLTVPDLIEKRSEKKPRRGYIKRYIFTSAQANTPIHKGFWTNLVKFADWCQAEVIVAPFTYANQGRSHTEFAEEVQPYLSRVQLDVADKLLFCGEVNTNPTAVHPLAGLETYTRNKWGVFPHPRVELRSIATMFNEPSKQIMTTGSVTVPHYLPRKAGVKAEFHHVVGALLVEVDGDGDLFCRHLQAEKDGSFYDLDVYVTDGKVSEFNSVDAITWGDIHSEQVDESVARASWGVLGMLDTLKPKVQFVHDLSDFSARNHHDIHDPHKRFKKHTEGAESVTDGLAKVVQTLLDMQRKDIACVIVESNHDLMLQRWLKEADFRSDPGNAIFYLEAQLALYRALHSKDDDFSIFEWAVRRILPDPTLDKNITFLREYSSYKRHNIEFALHGHKGANGARGHINSFAKMGSKAVTAHTHCLPAGYKVNVEGRGWVPLEVVTAGEQVAGYKDGRTLFTEVQETIRGTHTGKMVTFGRGGKAPLRQTVTSEHHLYLADGDYLPVGEAVATRSISEVPITALPVKGRGEYPVTDDDLRRIVAICADATNASSNTYRFHVKKERKRARIVELFHDALTRSPMLRKDGAYDAKLITSHPLTQRMVQLIGPVKQLPSWFMSLSSRQAEVVLSELPHWDGTHDTGSNGRQFGTVKDEEANIISSLALIAGYRVTCKKRSARNGGNHISYSKYADTVLEQCDKRRLSTWQVQTFDVIAEPVFCLRTTTSNFWIMDPATGQVSLTGNSPAIHEGIYCAGTSSKLDLGYNRGGLSSWAHAHVITYENGKRVIVTLQNGKWRA